jgi:lysophospholipase L1-like esterase
MSTTFRTPGRALWVVVVVLAALVVAPVAQATPTTVPPKAYYLALGDSLAYGYQQAKFNSEFPNVDPTTFNTGYVDDFASSLTGKLDPGMQVINDGCPGETSDSLINGGPHPGTCATGNGFPSVWLHHSYTGSQLADAVAFLNAHARQTSPVTLNIGANDLLATERACATQNGGTATIGFLICVQQQAPVTISHVAQNVGLILAQLEAAAPTTEIIVMGLYNPQFTLPGGDQLVQSFNSALSQVAAAAGARFADPLDAINHNPVYPNEAASVCSQIAICTSLQDIHPFDNGYQTLADVIFDGSNYATLK